METNNTLSKGDSVRLISPIIPNRIYGNISFLKGMEFTGTRTITKLSEIGGNTYYGFDESAYSYTKEMLVKE